ncbi:MAG: TonB family protein [Bacteroidota bacterium]
MLYYTIKVSICWAAFYLLYHLWLRRETFFNTNRFYLLATLCLSLMIPVLELPEPMLSENQESPVFYLQPITVGVQSLGYTIDEIVVTPMGETNSPSIGQLLLILYWLGVAFFSLRFLTGLWQIAKLYRKGQIENKGTYQQVHTHRFHLPFSFFNFLFWSEEFKVENDDHEKILRHELAHIRGWHSLDIIMLELLKIIFWYSPLIYLYKKSVQNIHEYLADAEVLQTTAKKHYGQLLLRHSQSGLQYALANNFIHSQLKKRIQMMMKHKSKRSALAKYLIALPILLLMTLLLSNQEIIAQINSSETVNNDDVIASALPINKEATIIPSTDPDPIFRVVEEMPRFPGCEEIADKTERESCAKEKMLRFVYSNIKYPAEARKNGVQGTVVVKFVVNKEGLVEQAETIRKIGGGCDEEALRIVNMMPKFIPGKQRGKKVNVFFHLPIKYKLAGEGEPNLVDVLKKEKEDNPPLIVIDGVKFLGKTIGELEVNPKDIKEISVLKGEAALTQYGEEGKNGVVLITTKNAKKESAETIHVIGHVAKKETALEERPRFPGCEDISDKEERKNCSNKELLAFIAEHINYPKEAAKAGVEGTVVVKFKVSAEGEVSEQRILRSVGHGCDEEVLRVMGIMAAMPERWVPAKDEAGKKVASDFALPIKFKLPEEEQKADQTDNFAGLTANNTLELKQFKVFPNPATENLNLSFLSPGGNLDIQISDINGKLLYMQPIDDIKGFFNQTIDLSSMPKGTLLLSIIQGDKVYSEKIILQ